jgi:hypothetical protein
MKSVKPLYKPLFESKVLDKVSYDGCTMTYTELGHLRVITCRHGNAVWEVTTNLVDRDIDRIWADIRREAGLE